MRQVQLLMVPRGSLRERGLRILKREGLTVLAHRAAALFVRELKSFSNWRTPRFTALTRSGLTSKGGKRIGTESLTILPQLEPSKSTVILNSDPVIRPRKPDIICFSIINWSFRFQRPQQIMSQFAANGHRVFYINIAEFRHSASRSKVGIRRIAENINEISLAMKEPFDLYSSVIEGENQATLLASLDELRHMCHIDEAIGYVMIASWGAIALAAQQKWKWRIVYDCMDEWENFPLIKAPVLQMERRLVQECDLLVVTGQRLYDKWHKDNNHPIVLARNGVNYSFFEERCFPNDLLANTPHPIIGYYGAIAEWFDVDLVAYLASSRKEYNFVLLGGVFGVDTSPLKSLPNVHLLGQQPYEKMPQYLYHFDVCMIPFKVNPITEATDPVKLYEFLSQGKPVVCPPLSELGPYQECLYIAESKEDFLTKLDLAVQENNRDLVIRRQVLAKQNTWEERYRQIQAGLAPLTPRASIIIVTFNNLAMTKLCVESIIRNTDWANHEIIIVDNQSKDGSQAYLRYLANRYSNIHVILNAQNNGFAKANNQGIAQATGEYIILLNNDTMVPPGWLSRLLRHLDDPSIGLVGPVTNFAGNEARIEVPYHTTREMENFAAENSWSHDGQIADINVLAMFCVAMRSSVYKEIGPLDEQFGIGMFEDDDYTQRMRAKGYRVVCALDTFVHHFGQAAFIHLIKNGSYDHLFEENRQRYEIKWNTKWVPHQRGKLVPIQADKPLV